MVQLRVEHPDLKTLPEVFGEEQSPSDKDGSSEEIVLICKAQHELLQRLFDVLGQNFPLMEMPLSDMMTEYFKAVEQAKEDNT